MNTKIEKLECVEMMKCARALQAELNVPETERCSLPLNFNLLRKVERINALTEQFETIVTDCRARLEALKTVVLTDAEKALEMLRREAEIENARKACTTNFANVQRLRSKAGLKGLPSVSLKSLSPEQLREYALSLQARALELAPKPVEAPVAVPTDCQAEFLRREQELSRKVWVAKPAKPMLAKAPAAEVVKIVEKSATRLALEASFAESIKVLTREHPLFHPAPERLSDKNLAALVARVTSEIERIKREALIKEHGRQQKLLSDYAHLRRSGRAHQPFGVWSKMARR
ncbi:MAG: hypothetical protein WCK01_01190 [Candidatus Uhrbacteria bacterium]